METATKDRIMEGAVSKPARTCPGGAHLLLKNLGYETAGAAPKTERPFDVDGLTVEPEEHGSDEQLFRIRAPNGTEWRLHSKIVLCDRDLTMLAHLIARMAPPGSTARLQADGHVAGTVFVGLVLNYEHTSIPVSIVSADIGCGLTLVPCVRSDGLQLRRVLEGTAAEDFHTYVLGSMRRSLKRGKVAEQGLTVTEYLREACSFYGETELEDWTREMKYVLDTIGIDYGEDVLSYVGRFAQSLGSSGNHFMELAEDDHCKYWLVVHSGSRALGAMVYKAVADACRVVSDGFEIATGPLAEFYTRAYDALNQFAKMNRVVCACAVLADLGLETRAAALQKAMASSELFAPAAAMCHGSEDALFRLLGGLTHNGLKAFVNDARQEVLYVLSKGAISIDRRASSAIVALRAGEGCVAFTMVDPACSWREVSLAEATRRAYQTVFDAGGGVIFAGHGAGRSQGTNVTARQSTFEEMETYYAEQGMVANIAPGMLGDNPVRAYKPSAEILQQLPLKEACTTSLLRTRVSHKEGMTFSKETTLSCAKFISSKYAASANHCVWCDFNLVRSAIDEDAFQKGSEARDARMEELERVYRGGFFVS